MCDICSSGAIELQLVIDMVNFKVNLQFTCLAAAEALFVVVSCSTGVFLCSDFHTVCASYAFSEVDISDSSSLGMVRP